ncbi:MAG TPA: hypothetical protein VE081_11105 [Sporichthyaceae bacterium]|nr:hypothetical protein [Sporichthyaceae bacterium]
MRRLGIAMVATATATAFGMAWHPSVSAQAAAPVVQFMAPLSSGPTSGGPAGENQSITPATVDQEPMPAAADRPANLPLPIERVCDIVGQGLQTFYPGPAGSALYDQLFKPTFAIPYLADKYTPQGMAVWPRWFNDGGSLVIIGMYSKGHDSYLVGVDPANGAVYGTIRVLEAHLGGLAVVGDWLFAQDQAQWGGESVRKYRLVDLAAAFEQSHTDASKPYVKRWGGTQPVYNASFMSSYNGHLWAGHHGGQVDKMYEYSVSSDGVLTQVGDPWEVPGFTDGLVVTADRFLFISHNSDGDKPGFVTVTAKNHHLTDGPGQCFGAPSLGEGAVLDNGQVLVVYESGSYRFAKSANKVTHMHEAPYASLSAMADPSGDSGMSERTGQGPSTAQ